MTRRRPLSTKKRMALFVRKNGICHLCGEKIVPPDAWDVSHPIPLEMGGADDESNHDIAHRRCHRPHTATVDIPAIAKAKRREAKHVGAKAPPVRPIRSAPFPKAERRVAKSMLPPRPLYRRKEIQ